MNLRLRGACRSVEQKKGRVLLMTTLRHLVITVSSFLVVVCPCIVVLSKLREGESLIQEISASRERPRTHVDNVTLFVFHLVYDCGAGLEIGLFGR